MELFLVAFLLSFAGQFFFRWLAARLRLRRRRVYAISGLGLTAGLLLPLWISLAGENQALVAGGLRVLTAAFLGGMLSDVLRLPRLAQGLAGMALAYWAAQQGFLIRELKPPFFQSLVSLGPRSAPVSAVWILAVAYAVILCRRLPGLTSGLAAIISLSFLAVAQIVFASAAPLTAPLACAIAGAALGAFPHSLPPPPLRPRPSLPPLALGAAGHWVLGFALGLLSVVGFLKNTAFLLLAAPLLLLGVPVVEATYAFVYGGAQRRFSFSLGRRRELLHEALLRGGLSPRRCLAVFLAITLYFSALAILLALMVRLSFLVKLAALGVFGAAGFVLFYCAARILSRIQRSVAEEKVDFLEVPVTAVDMEGALRKIEAFVQARTPHMIVTPDSSAIVRAHKDEELAAILRAADLVAPDGAGVVWMAKVLGLPIEQRVSGVDLVAKICARAAANGWSVYFMGAAPGVAEEAARKLQERYPDLRIAGCRHGYFTAQEEEQVVEEIAACRPEVLFVGLGIPRQEKWIARHLPKLAVPVAIGVGGSFDVISGRLQRAPKWMQTAGLEWLYRTLQQPKRIPRLIALPRLLALTLKEALLKRHRD